MRIEMSSNGRIARDENSARKSFIGRRSSGRIARDENSARKSFKKFRSVTEAGRAFMRIEAAAQTRAPVERPRCGPAVS
jgi:hypothetical protein